MTIDQEVGGGEGVWASISLTPVRALHPSRADRRGHCCSVEFTIAFALSICTRSPSMLMEKSLWFNTVYNKSTKLYMQQNNSSKKQVDSQAIVCSFSQRQPDFWHLEFDLVVDKLHFFHRLVTRGLSPLGSCLLKGKSKVSSLGSYNPWRIHFYSSWIVFTAGRAADKINKNKISQDKLFQWCGSNTEHARDLMASPITDTPAAQRSLESQYTWTRTRAVGSESLLTFLLALYDPPPPSLAV